MLNSIVEYYAEHEKYKCGYCKRPDGSYTHGMWAHSLTVTDYQDLLDRGWRRSGKYCYKPMDVTCCPMYTVRCKALDFKPSRSQKKVLKKFNKFLMDQELAEQPNESSRKMSTCSSDQYEIVPEDEDGLEQFVETTKQHQNIDISSLKAAETHEGLPETVMEGTCETEEIPSSTFSKSVINESKGTNFKKGAGPDPTKEPCKKAKQLRKERKLEKLKEKGVDISTLSSNNKNKEKQLEDFINELPDEIKNKLEIRLVRTNPPSPEWLATAKASHEVYVKYQTVIHGDRPEKCTESKFRDFLVQSPLLEQYGDAAPPCGYGSFHQQYWSRGALLAVAVLDVLPRCVSSVYFFYDPRHTALALGTYGALRVDRDSWSSYCGHGLSGIVASFHGPQFTLFIREIAFTRHLHTLSPELKYYYMGYYIHSCPKMRYKGNFHPSDLLCPETYKWFSIQSCLPKLDVSAYSRLDPDIDSLDENSPKEADINYIHVLVKGTVMVYKMYKRKYSKKKDDIQEIEQYSRLVGAKSAKSLILVR